MLVEFSKGSASIISSNMAKISLSLKSHGIGCTPPIVLFINPNYFENVLIFDKYIDFGQKRLDFYEENIYVPKL